jgi:hypothetical protein
MIDVFWGAPYSRQTPAIRVISNPICEGVNPPHTSQIVKSTLPGFRTNPLVHSFDTRLWVVLSQCVGEAE